MNAQERLRQAIDEQQSRLRASIPPDRVAAILAILQIQNRLASSPRSELLPDLITGRRILNLGGNKALQLCFESTNDSAPAKNSDVEDLHEWGERFLQDCGQLAEAELVLAHCETGFMRIIDGDSQTFDAWIATKRPPTSWRERADIDWWASLLASHYEPERNALIGCGPAGDLVQYRQLAELHLKMIAYQIGYPPEAVIGGCTVQTYCDVLGWLISKAIQDRDCGVALRSEHSLITAMASDLAIDPGIIGHALSAFTLDRENAAYHAAVPGVAAAPLLRVAPDRIACSLLGLTTEPLFFLIREIRRRDAQEYHNSGYLREAVFRQDLYALFEDRRFVTSVGRIQLRRTGGDVRTDIDAAVFDRKTGTLGIFELKSQDPFARSTAELTRQRDNFLFANRQISGTLDWIKRHGAQELLERLDSRTAKTFRAHKIYPFVLGRYLAHFNDGAEPDRRAAWGTWPQLLRLLDEQPLRASDANPIASLFTRLARDIPLPRQPPSDLPREIDVGVARLVVHPSYAMFQAGSAGARSGVE